jgi:hypothetical protein
VSATQTSVGTSLGLEITADFPIPGLRDDPAGATVGTVTVERDDAPERPWRGEPAMLKRTPAGRLLASLHTDPERGMRMFAAGYGTFILDRDARRIVCHPAPDAPEWLWHRFLLGQALPYAAVLQGGETFHAAAVIVGGRAVAIAGQSGAGKSSVALNLAVGGAPFCTDDVITIAPGQIGVAPGPAVANVRDVGLRRRAEAGEMPFSAIIGRCDESVRATVDSTAHVEELGAVYFVDRDPRYEGLTIRPMDDPFRLIGHTFNAMIRSEVRLKRQLDTCARIAARANLFDALVGPGVSAHHVAGGLHAHMARSLPD